MKLVTGGSGYLGSHIAKELLDKGEQVRIFDVSKTKYIPDEAEFIQGDMRDFDLVQKSLKGVDIVYHLAFVQSLSKLPEKVRWDININGTENFLKASVKEGIKRFVHTSTIEIYGTRPPCPCTEDSPTDNPVGWYGRHKLVAEDVVNKYHKEHGLETTMLRMPTICGPGFYNHRPLLLMMDRIIDNKPLGVIGDGSIYGDFVYYKDVMQGYFLAAEKDEAVGEAFNISCDTPSTHYEVVTAMIDEIKSKTRIFNIPRWLSHIGLNASWALRLSDLPRCQFDYLFNNNVYTPKKANRLLGYKATKSAAESAVELIKGYITDRDFVKKRSKNY